MVTICGVTLTGKEHKRSLWSTGSGPYLDLGSGYTSVFALKKFTEMYPNDLLTSVCVCVCVLCKTSGSCIT